MAKIENDRAISRPVVKGRLIGREKAVLPLA